MALPYRYQRARDAKVSRVLLLKTVTKDVGEAQILRVVDWVGLAVERDAGDREEDDLTSP